MKVVSALFRAVEAVAFWMRNGVSYLKYDMYLNTTKKHLLVKKISNY